jgi:hypothetical protein
MKLRAPNLALWTSTHIRSLAYIIIGAATRLEFISISQYDWEPVSEYHHFVSVTHDLLGTYLQKAFFAQGLLETAVSVHHRPPRTTTRNNVCDYSYVVIERAVYQIKLRAPRNANT